MNAEGWVMVISALGSAACSVIAAIQASSASGHAQEASAQGASNGASMNRAEQAMAENTRITKATSVKVDALGAK